MTTIAYRAGVLAADTAATRGTVVVIGVVKIAHAPSDDRLAGAVGDAGYNGAFLRWFLAGAEGEPPEAKKDGDGYDTGLIFMPDGEVRLYEPSGWFSMRPAYYAIGSGKEMALGAMFHGASAEDAVKAAMAHDPYTRGPMTVLRHNEG